MEVDLSRFKITDIKVTVNPKWSSIGLPPGVADPWADHTEVMVVCMVPDIQTGIPSRVMERRVYSSNLPIQIAVKDMVLRLLGHEVEEALLIDGKQAFYPHCEGCNPHGRFSNTPEGACPEHQGDSR